MAFPDINFADAYKGIMSLPVQQSSTNEFIGWIRTKGLDRPIMTLVNQADNNDNQVARYKTDISLATIANSVGRAVATLFVLPAIATLGTLYNFGVGLGKLGFGLVTHIKITPQMEQAQANEMRENARKGMNQGIQHLLTAVYDFAVGMFSLLTAIAYGIAPHSVREGHEKIFGIAQDNKDSLIARSAKGVVDAMVPHQDQVQLTAWERFKVAFA